MCYIGTGFGITRPGKELLAHQIISEIVLDFPTSRTVKNKCLVFLNHPVYGVLLYGISQYHFLQMHGLDIFYMYICTSPLQVFPLGRVL